MANQVKLFEVRDGNMLLYRRRSSRFFTLEVYGRCLQRRNFFGFGWVVETFEPGVGHTIKTEPIGFSWMNLVLTTAILIGLIGLCILMSNLLPTG